MSETTITKSKPKMKWRNFWVCFSISLGQVAFGYPSSIIGTTLGQPAFLEYMGLVTATGLAPNANGLIGATSGVFQTSFTYRLDQNNSNSRAGWRIFRYPFWKSRHGQMGP